MKTPRLCLYQPDIPQNTAAILRTAACLGVTVDIIEPCGFAFDDRKMRRSGMDYLDNVSLIRHSSWDRFQEFRSHSGENSGRLVLATTKASVGYTEFEFKPDDYILFGRESAGVPDNVHDAADARIIVPLAPGNRSLNLAASAAMILGEALRQTGGFPQTL